MNTVFSIQGAWVMAGLFTALAGSAAATEEPHYRVLRTLSPSVEVREYEAYAVAEVDVAGAADNAGNLAFPILAGYIFGKNKGERRLEMTAPVTQSASVPVKLDMTAPVTQAASGAGTYRVQFVLPRGVTAKTAPEPLDARVQLRDVQPPPMAVIRYSGFWSESNYQQHLEQLRATLGQEGLTAAGEPVYARYDAPYTPWFLRRNEVWLPLAGKP